MSRDATTESSVTREVIEIIRATLSQYQIVADNSEEQAQADLATTLIRFQLDTVCDLAIKGLAVSETRAIYADPKEYWAAMGEWMKKQPKPDFDLGPNANDPEPIV